MADGTTGGVDWATWAGAAVAWVGVLVSGYFARKAQGHAEMAHEATMRQTERHHAEVAAQTERLTEEAATRAAAEREDEQRSRVRVTFVGICSMRLNESSRRVVDQADALYNLLGDSPEARYITSTAFAFAAYGDPSWGQPTREAGLARERDDVLAYLSGKVGALKIPATGEVRTYFKPAPPGTIDASAFRNKRWVLKPTD